MCWLLKDVSVVISFRICLRPRWDLFNYRGHVGESQLLHDYNLSIAELSLTEEILQIPRVYDAMESIASLIPASFMHEIAALSYVSSWFVKSVIDLIIYQLCVYYTTFFGISKILFLRRSWIAGSGRF